MIDTLLAILADGRFHSGQELGEQLSVSRSAIWKQIRKLEELGLEVYSVKGRGYRIPGGLDLLQQPLLREYLNADVAAVLGPVTIELTTQSTNQQAMQAALAGDAHASVYLAEQQMAGRGRRGRNWHSPFACNLYASLVWRFSRGAAALEGLSLVVGLAIERALHDLRISDVALKWPNDLLWRGRKLAGILLEMSGDASGECQVVIGFGVNVDMSHAQTDSIDQPWTDLRQMGADVSRNQLAAAVLNRLVPMLEVFAEQGFGPFLEDWQAVNAYQNQPVRLLLGRDEVTGLCRGVAGNGALLLETSQGVEAFHGGEISMRGL